MQKKLIAEAVGTFFLSLTVILSLSGTFPLITPILAALVVLLFVYTIGGISGAHINPAVTVGLWSIKKIDTTTAGKYVLSQMIGAMLAILITTLAQITIPPVPSIPLQGYLFELVGMVVFSFSIGAVVFDDKKALICGVIVGGALLLGISISVMGGAAGILNPAVGVALKTMYVGYYVAQILGGILGFQLYSYLANNKSRKKV